MRVNKQYNTLHLNLKKVWWEYGWMDGLKAVLKIAYSNRKKLRPVKLLKSECPEKSEV